jgi:hypothetical protein
VWSGLVSLVLFLTWFLALIGGYFAGGWINLLLPLAAGIYLGGSMRRHPG